MAGNTGNTVVAGTLNAGATTVSTLSSGRRRCRARWMCRGDDVSSTLGVGSTCRTLDVAGDVDVNSGKLHDGLNHDDTLVAGTLDVAGDVDVNSGMFAVTASDGSLAIQTNKFTVAGGTGNTVVSGILRLEARRRLFKEVYVTGDIEATGTLAIGGDATFAGAVTVTGLFTALGDYRIGDSAPSDSLTVNAVSSYTGTTTMSSTLDVIGAATLESTLSVGGATTLSSTLGVVSDVSVGAVGARKLVVSGSDGSLADPDKQVQVDGGTGNTVVAGTLNAGATTVNT